MMESFCVSILYLSLAFSTIYISRYVAKLLEQLTEYYQVFVDINQVDLNADLEELEKLWSESEDEETDLEKYTNELLFGRRYEDED